MKTKIIAKAIVLDADDKLLLLRRSQTDVRRPGQWDFPGGSVDEGEDFALAVARETMEEAGITIKPRHLDVVFTKTRADARGNILFLFFVTRTAETAIVLSYEHDKYTWMSLPAAITEVQYDLHRETLQHIQNHDLLTDLPL